MKALSRGMAQRVFLSRRKSTMTIGEWAGRCATGMSRIISSAKCSAGDGWTMSSRSRLLVALTLYLAAAIPNFTRSETSRHSRQIGEFGLIVIGMTIVMLAGGIDLSVGSNFALANLTALALINVAKWPVEAAIAATLGVGALVGLINGFLIGFLRLRAFLTTLVMLTLIRAIVDLLLQIYSVRIASSDVESDALGLRRLGIGFRRAVQLRGSDRHRDRRALRAYAAAHRLAHHGGRRIASRGL
jgi:hypothetical protein